jgi:DNA-binding response OmpR family regulator
MLRHGNAGAQTCLSPLAVKGKLRPKNGPKTILKGESVRILLVENDAAVAASLTSRLSAAGYVVDLATDLGQAEHAATLSSYRLIILDRDLPEGDGLLSIRALKAAIRDVRIIVLTALGSLNDKVAGLDAGADDYLTKTVQFDELLARMRAALRRPGGISQTVIQCAGVTFDPETRAFSINGEPAVFNRRQHLILETLMMKSRGVIHREAILEQVYGFDDDVQSNTLDSHISRLRSLLSALDSGVEIQTVRGIGYMLSESKTWKNLG